MRFFPSTPAPNPAEVKAAWHDFVRNGSIEPARVRPHILRAWNRSRSSGCNPYLAQADVLSPLDTMALLKHESALVNVAAPFLSALSRAAGKERHAAMLSDGSGRVLKVVADPLTAADPEFPRAGSLLSETVAGANGIGTALAEGHYVELVGPEHFIEGFHPFTCQGVPLAGSVGRMSGVISMSLRRAETASKVRDVLFCASEAAECEILAANLASYIIRAASAGPKLETLRQDIIQGIAQARLQIELAAYQIANSEDSIMPLDTAYQLSLKFKRQAAIWRDLADLATSAPEPILLSDLVSDFMNLMETEARVANVKLVHGRMDRVLVLEDARALSQRLLDMFLSGFQSVQPPTEITIEVFERGPDGICRAKTPGVSGDLINIETNAPLLRAVVGKS